MSELTCRIIERLEGELAQLRADLATVTAKLAERASMGSLQDMAAKLNDAGHNLRAECIAHSRTKASLATVTTERDRMSECFEQSMASRMIIEQGFNDERAAHAETRKALELQTELKVIALRGEQRSQTDLESTRDALARSEADLALQRRAADAAGACFLIEIRELKARVKELETALHAVWKNRHVLPSSVCTEIRTVLRG